MTQASTLAASPAAVRSMTGYATVRRSHSLGEITASLRTVNGRNLDLHFHMASEFAPFENSLRTLLKSQIRRGHVEVRLSVAPGADTGGALYNQALLARYMLAFRVASQEFELTAQPDLNVLLSMPGVLENNASGIGGPLPEPEVIAAMHECSQELNRFREREGAELATAILVECADIERLVEQVAEVRAGFSGLLQKRLEERLTALLGDTALPAARLVEETAILADRSDIQEELIRLRVHTRELRRMLAEGGDVGKRLDFLMQEINRETNTILSKSSGIGDSSLTITNLGIALKANIERIREQALNLE